MNSVFRCFLLVGLFAAAAALPLPGFSQETSSAPPVTPTVVNPPPLPPPTPAVDDPAPAIPATATVPVTAPTVAKEPLRVERSIYLPFEDLEKVFEKEGRGVYLPYREFLDLWNQLAVHKKDDEVKPPVDGVVASADFKATLAGVDDHALAIEATLKVESFKEKGWAVIPLAQAGLNIAEAETGDATLSLNKDGGYQLLAPHKGSYDIKLKLYARIDNAGSRHLASLNLPRAGVSKFEAVLPGQGWEFEIQPAAAYSSEALPDDKTRFAFFFGETEHFEVAWQKQGEETKLTPLLFAEAAVTSRVIPGAVQTTADLQYRVLRSGVDTFEISVPAGLEILGVTGQNIKEWDVKPPGEGSPDQRLTVHLHAPVRQSYGLTVSLEQPLDSLPMNFTVPVVRAENVVRQRGTLIVSKYGELDLETVKAESLTQQALPGGAPAPSGALEEAPFASYRYLTLPYLLDLSVKKAEPLVEVESWTRYAVEIESSRFTTRFDYQIKRAGIFGTKIRLPQGFEGVECTGAVVEDFSETEADGARYLNVKFSSRAIGAVHFEVTGRRTRAQAADDETLPVFAPQDVARHEARVAVQVHTSLDPNTRNSGDMRQMDVAELPVPVGPKQQQQNQQQGAMVPAVPVGIPGTGPLTVAFRYRGEGVPAVLGFKLKEPQVIADVFTLVSVKDQAVRYQWTVAYNVQYAGVDTFVFSLPSSIAGDLRVEGDLIKETQKPYTPPAGADGVVPSPGEGREFWAVMLRDKRMGAYELKLTLDRPLSESATAAVPVEAAAGAPTVAAGAVPDANEARDFLLNLPEIQISQVFQESGQIAVVKDDNLEILDAPTVNLQIIDPKELDARLVGSGGAIQAYKYRRHPLKLELKVSRNEFLKVPSIVVTYAALKSVVAPDRAVTTEAVYWVKNNTSQFISAELPSDGRMVSDVLVNGVAQQPMRRANENHVLIRLPTGEEHRQTAFPVRFVYETPGPDPGKKPGWLGTFSVPVIRLADADILQSQIELYLPQDFVYRHFESAMRLPVSERGWSRFRNAFAWMIPTLGPQLTTGQQSVFQAPPQPPGATAGGFDIQVPVDGRRFLLQRLDAPDDIVVSFQSQGFAFFTEALCCLLTFSGGIFLLRRPALWKLAYFGALGMLPLIIGGAVSPGAASFWNALFLGTALAAVVWVAVAGWRSALTRVKTFLRWFGGLGWPARLGWITGTLVFLLGLPVAGFFFALFPGALGGLVIWVLALSVRYWWLKRASRRDHPPTDPPASGTPVSA